jgi:hypothetical protein
MKKIEKKIKPNMNKKNIIRVVIKKIRDIFMIKKIKMTTLNFLNLMTINQGRITPNFLNSMMENLM